MQPADAVQQRIEGGELSVGARLPGERDLAREYRVALGTAGRAVQELRDRDLVMPTHRRASASRRFISVLAHADDLDDLDGDVALEQLGERHRPGAFGDGELAGDLLLEDLDADGVECAVLTVDVLLVGGYADEPDQCHAAFGERFRASRCSRTARQRRFCYRPFGEGSDRQQEQQQRLVPSALITPPPPIRHGLATTGVCSS
ncbi:GntR family transcriptional regulator [Streptomyces montanisoli]|uniref:GntR family transcriptional regulator n=1 Tax=Streptomyces montanisoli TaxID=2798581 RepID=A0A940MEZ5_9ACTN|nr:GntR family transcriptional regulator [Streptomyces montanisoli]MBP0458382.1 GntR family transcriptional regulator [Streptomyces montanisoli]